MQVIKWEDEKGTGDVKRLQALRWLGSQSAVRAAFRNHAPGSRVPEDAARIAWEKARSEVKG
jgi:hypothetical protein